MKETTLSGASADIRSENLQKLRQIFPEVFCEGSIDFDKLRAMLGETIDEDKERYNFTWWGKSRALRLAQTPSMGTLRPCKAESKNWDTTGNLYLEGDNLEVLKLLQKSYHNRVKMIYIDPPYNTGNDFVYKDDYKDPLQNYLQMTNQLDEEGRKLGTNSEASGRYHTNWLNMMYPRLRLARSLLREDGVIFISIDDNENENLRKLCNEVFGEENFVAQIIWKKRSTPPNDKIIGAQHDYIIVYQKNENERNLFLRPRTDGQLERYKNPDNNPKGSWIPGDLMANVKGGRYVPSLHYPITNPRTGQVHYPGKNGNWRFNKEKIKTLIENNEIYFGEDDHGKPKLKRFLSDVKPGITWTTIWDFVPFNISGSQEMDSIFGSSIIFESPKPVGLLSNLLQMASASQDIILDFFSGSATTAHAVMQLNAEDGGQRKYILVQLPEPTAQDSEAHKAGFANICEIGKERIRRAGEQIKAELIEKQKGQPSLLEGEKHVNPDELDIGFKVFKLDSSNLKKWKPDSENLEASLLDAVENFVDDRSELDLVYEILLKYGVDLSLPIEEFGHDNNKIYSVGGGALLLCLGRQIGAQAAEELVRLKQKLNPEITRVVFRDNGFTDDSAKTNAKELLRNAGVDEIVSI
jgi:adenine-specific DNA-methyltransferase